MPTSASILVGSEVAWLPSTRIKFDILTLGAGAGISPKLHRNR